MSGRRHRRLERPRERVLEEAWALLTERGLADLSLAELGRRLDTSAGHLSYYVGSKSGLLLELLRWSEDQLAEERERIIAATDAPPIARLREVCLLNLPRFPGDPRWVLWAELWPRVLHEPALREAQVEYDAAWREAVARLLREAGLAEGDVAPLARRIVVLMDGLSVSLLTGDDDLTADGAWEHVRALLPDGSAGQS